MKKNHKIFFISTFLFLPNLSFAFSLADSNFKGVIVAVLDILWILIPVLTSVAFLVFFWGLSKFILNSNKPEEIKKGKNYMLWGVLALFLLLTYRAIIGLVASELEFGDGRNFPLLKTGSDTPTPNITTDEEFRLP